MDSSHHFVAASLIEGTPVFDVAGKRLGKIEDLMIDKKTGAAAYALMGHDGFLGLAEKFYPVPWSMLTYDEKHRRYVAPITKDQLNNGHAVDREVEDECEWRERVHAYYGATPYWMITSPVV